MTQPSSPPAPEATPSQPRRRISARDAQTFANKYGILILVVGLTILLSFASEAFLQPQNLLNILSQIAPLAIIAAAGIGKRRPLPTVDDTPCGLP